jgi:hypothetical protein
MKKITLILLTAVLSLFVGLGIVYWSKDRILTYLVPRLVSDFSGTEVQIKTVSLSLPEQSVVIEGVRIYNPPGFAEGILAEVPIIQARVDIESLFKRRVYLPFLKINIERVNIYINAKQRNNIQAFLDVRRSKEKKVVAEVGSARVRAVKPWSFQVDRLALILGSVIVKDYSVAEKPTVSPYYVFNYQIYENISDARHLGTRLVIDAIKMANIQGLALRGVSMLSGTALRPVQKAGNYLGWDPLTETVQHGATSLTKAMFLPYEATGTLLGEGTVKIKIGIPYERVYQGVCNVLEQQGEVTRKDNKNGIVLAQVQNTTISVRFKRAPGETELVIVAKKWLVAKPHFARGLVYYLARDLAKDYPVQATNIFLRK